MNLSVEPLGQKSCGWLWATEFKHSAIKHQFIAQFYSY